MKYLLILFVLIIVGCSTNDPCHTCKGLSPEYLARIQNDYITNKIDVERYHYLENKARACRESVCDGNDYCTEHRR